MGEAAKNEVPPNPNVQTICLAHGEVYRRDLTGRFKGESEEHLQERKVELERQWKLLTDTPVSDGSSLPLHIQVEYLETILDFELHPPCGCTPPALPNGFWEGL